MAWNIQPDEVAGYVFVVAGQYLDGHVEWLCGTEENYYFSHDPSVATATFVSHAIAQKVARKEALSRRNVTLFTLSLREAQCIWKASQDLQQVETDGAEVKNEPRD